MKQASQKLWILCPALGALFALLFAPYGIAAGQDEFFKATDLKNRGASDDSLKHSTAYAMNALMDLSNLNIKSAVNNGMTAYGKYRNSETLDKLGDQNIQRAGSLASVGSAVSTSGPTNTTFRRLDPSFLRKGKFGEIASEFEKRSGMPREKFLAQMSDVSEKKIRRSDPKLVDKVVGRFENFVAQIPNPDFRNKLQKGVEMVPATVRTGLISQAVSKFANATSGAALPTVSEISSANLSPTSPTPASEPIAEAYIPVTGVDVKAEERAPASEPTAPEHVDASDGSNPLGSIIQAAIATQGQDTTIFQQVSRRYRIVTPLVSKTESP